MTFGDVSEDSIDDCVTGARLINVIDHRQVIRQEVSVERTRHLNCDVIAADREWRHVGGVTYDLIGVSPEMWQIRDVVEY